MVKWRIDVSDGYCRIVLNPGFSFLMTQTLAEDTDFGTSTSVSGNWENDFTEIAAAPVTSIAVVVVAIDGQDALRKKLGDGEAQQAVDRYMNRVLRAAEGFGGRTVDTRASEIVIDFGQADVAMLSAIDMQKRVAVLPPVSGIKLGLRIGMSCGFASERPEDAVEGIVETAMSLAKLAEGGQIMACIRAQAAMSDEVRGRFDAYCGEWNNTKAVAHVGAPVVMPAKPVETAALPPKTETAVPTSLQCLIVVGGGKTLVLNDANPRITIGRHPDNQLVIDATRVSRHHAQISLRDNRVVFADTSTNGTFVTSNNASLHQLVKKGECFLAGTGVLAFSPAGAGGEGGGLSVRFEVLAPPA